ncbi:MAG: DUF4296 domain-containing protein [Flavobacteriales bacterium]|nr:DUF4296 domain-containing protein [Flavobacteriales bacterium]MBK6943844.1 DUF4296 domain-containing protein [Flavobacteriales bacterium]MBK7240053.1 DUF4296 domain-containing protein [Flavobacteriales bacterium]MBK7297105.1 DUF4296 domain-containing protein [Flavobacteriales bacterium]MBK9535624.1 DUF4296 domain-containing protein [Flavobacteriales bacterium]
MKLTQLLLVALLFACGTKKAQPPADLLPREKFVSVLLEAQLIEARMNHELTVSHMGEVPSDEYYAELFAEQGTTKEQFQATFDHYSEHPNEMESIYEEIITELSKRKDGPSGMKNEE